MIVETLAVGPLGCNCVILGCPETRRALVVDPGGDADRIAALLGRHGLTPVACVHTHAHFDHVMGTPELKARFGPEIMLHAGDRPLYENLAMQGAAFGFQLPPAPPVDRYVSDGERLAIGTDDAEVIHTPGHSPGSICLHVGSQHLLLTGDTLFAGGIGRTDLWGGSHADLMRSIRERLLPLAPETRVIPGHGPETTLGEEARTNPFLTGAWA
jgi:glyoxylase-like metal-dependent hydrolase (beta-lactamase superfamily II)